MLLKSSELADSCEHRNEPSDFTKDGNF